MRRRFYEFGVWQYAGEGDGKLWESTPERRAAVKRANRQTGANRSAAKSLKGVSFLKGGDDVCLSGPGTPGARQGA